MTILPDLFRERFVVRHPTVNDVQALVQLDAVCWGESLCASESELLARIANHAEGHLLLEMDGDIVGIIYSQRIDDTASLSAHTSESVGALHRPGGSLLQLLALNIHPCMQGFGLGDQLLELRLHSAHRLLGLSTAVAVTRCRDYANHRDTPLDAYIYQRGKSGLLCDPILRMHDIRGAHVVGLVPGYRPRDVANHGHGVLVRYDLETRVPRRAKSGGSMSAGATLDATQSAVGANPPEQAAAAVRTAIADIMRAKGVANHDPDVALRDLGLDSLDLSMLRQRIEALLGVELAPTFFFSYCTTRAVIAYALDVPSPEEAGERRSLEPSPVASRRFESRPLVELSHAVESSHPVHPPPDDSIAVIGMSCRFPAGVDSPAAYWDFLHTGGDAIGTLPPERIALEPRWADDHDGLGPTIRMGGFIDGVDCWDAPFFRLAPREASATDPQQRLLLKLSWEALEHAGVPPDHLEGSDTGVYTGVFSHDYERLQLRYQTLSDLDVYFGTGNSSAVTAGRIAYYFGLRGPALAVNTACSSSAVAVHLACQSLRREECTMALAGGVNLLLSPELSLTFARAGMLSQDGRCKTFDAAANGYVRSEGGGIFVLERTVDALAKGHRILAIIRGSAVNQDGASNGLTAPSESAQVEVIRKALSDASLPPSAIDYVEAHGTGTSLGDPIEMRALHKVYGARPTDSGRLNVGSVKTNIGHTEAAASVAGIMKVILALQAGHIPANLHYRQPNSAIEPFLDTIEISGLGRPWPANNLGTPRRAAVSSFGFSGTNAHLIIEQAPPSQTLAAEADDTPAVVFVSARTPNSLSMLARAYADYAMSHTAARLDDIAWTSVCGRTHFPHRICIEATERQQLAERLWQYTDGDELVGCHVGVASETAASRLVFMFTGQGSQYPGMGRELFEVEPVFRNALLKCEEILRDTLEQPLLSVMFAPRTTSPIDETRYTQPALFSLEWALYQLWRSWGLEPRAVLGHSIGEFVAACVAGVFSLEDGLRLIAHRGRLMQAQPQNGAMVAVFAPGDVVQDAVAPFSHEVSIAANNGDALTVISGMADAVQTVVDQLSEKWRTSRLNVSHAFHSSMMRPAQGPFQEILDQLSLQVPQIPLFCNRDGSRAGAEMATSGYWARHIVAPVEFAAAVRHATGSGYDTFVELGPHAVLCRMVGRIAGLPKHASWLSSSIRGRPALGQLNSVAGALFVRGIDLDWRRFLGSRTGGVTALPTYRFERRPYWFDMGRVATDKVAEPDSAIPERMSKGVSDVIFSVEWRSRPVVDEIPTHECMPTPLAISSDVGGVNEQPTSQPDLTRRLEQASLAYVLGALRELGWRYEAGQRFTSQEMLDALTIDSRHHRLGRHFLRILANQGMLEHTANGWLATRSLSDVIESPQGALAQLQDVQERACVEIELLTRCGEALPKVLRGEVDPVQLLFPNADLAALTSLYDRSAAFGRLNELAALVIDEISHEWPADRPIRVLEIGGGTGGTTAHLLPRLPADRTEYVFTDVSNLFLDKAKRRFSSFAFVRYERLDIERSPAEQLSLGGSFDVVVAANVLHATVDLQQTVEHARALLSPGGLLLLVEGVQPRLWIDVIFGLLDGWWRMRDHVLRPHYPLLQVDAWRSLFVQTGFDHTDALLSESDQSAALFPQAVLLARRNVECEQKTQISKQRWMLLDEPGGSGEQLAQVLRTRGHTCILAYRAQMYEAVSDDTIYLNPNRLEHVERMLRTTLESGQLDHIVHFWHQPTSGEPTDLSPPISLDACVEVSCRSALTLVQALARLERSVVPSLWFVTSGAGDDVFSPAGLAQTPVWGLANVVMHELPWLSCRVLDWTPFGAHRAARDEMEALVYELTRLSSDNARPEPFVVLRGRERHVSRFVHSLPTESTFQPLSVHVRGAYLVTGGLGGLGLLVARWLVERGAQHIVLIGRHAPNEQATREIRALESKGAQVYVLAADVTDRDELKSAVMTARDVGDGNLCGIVHCAGILEDRIISNQDWPLFQRVLAAKVTGAWNLHSLTLDDDLDFFVLFSSVFAVLGGAGLSNYVAANAFLGGLARYRRHLGRPGLAIHWGLWAGTGMVRAFNEQQQNHWRERGIGTLAPELGIEALSTLLDNPCTEVTVSRIVGSALRERAPVYLRDSLLDELQADESAETDANISLLRQLHAMEPPERSTSMRDHLRAQIASVLGFPTPQAVDVECGFFHMGMDSLTSMELCNRLEASIECTVSPVILLKYSNVMALGRYLLSSLSQDGVMDEVPEPGQHDDDVGREHNPGLSTTPSLAVSDVLSEFQLLTGDAFDGSLQDDLEQLEELLGDMRD